MKKVYLIFIIIVLAKPVWAQFNYRLYSQTYTTGTTDKPENIGLIVNIVEMNNSFWVSNPNRSLLSGEMRNKLVKAGRKGEIIPVTTFDTSKAQFLLHGVDSSNAASYEYRVMNYPDKIIRPWSRITQFADKGINAISGMPKMAYLGGYKAEDGDWIIVDVRKKGEQAISQTAVVGWVKIKPVIKSIYNSQTLSIFFHKLSQPWQSNPQDDSLVKKSLKYGTGADKNKLLVQAGDKNLIYLFAADIYDRRQVEYELIKDDKVIRPWGANEYVNNFVWLKDLNPGDYKLNIRFAAQREHVTTEMFEVITPWYASVWFRAGVISAIISILLNIRNRREAKKELAKKTKLQLELKSIYAQLNPHFIFNALSSIQGLINKQDIKGANEYLSDFARLMRESLNNGNKERVSVDKELKAMETYLKLEQLRFGFGYEIRVDEQINIYETEIPSLLLQPIIENAVKHGVSALQEKGRIELAFVKRDNDMLITIIDNGIGFNGYSNENGFGLKLTRDRIKLLNDFNKSKLQEVKFEIQKNEPEGTRIAFIFNNWFL